MGIKVVLADDHRLMREGLRLILDRAGDVEVVGEAEDGLTTLRLVGKLSPDVVVMDIGMPDLNGIEATRQITGENPQIKVIALSSHADRRYVLAMLEAGASGYIVKDTAGEELLQAIRSIMRGQKHLSSQVAGLVVDSYVNRQFPGEDQSSAANLLTARERQVVQLLAEGNSSKEIARQLHLATATVETHRRHIMRKLDLHNIAALTRYAIREGLTSLET